jgi:histidyl-tRNA synthetase
MVACAAVSADQGERVLSLAEMKGSNVEILARLESDFGTNERAAEGIHRLRELITVAVESGVPEERLAIDLSIARGLDYYTGTIYETFLTDKPDIGSICSGGRYDNLAGVYTKQTLPGVGASLGLDRLLAAMEELKLIGGAVSPAPVLLVQFATGYLAVYEKMARALRGEGIGVEVYPEPKKMGAQLQYAEKRGFRIAVIARPDDLAKGVWNVLDIASKQESPSPTSEVAATIRRLLGA